MREYFIESRSRKLCVCELFLFYYVEYHSLLLCELLLIIFLFGEKRRQEVDRTDWYKPDDEHFKKDDWYGIRESSEDSLVDRSGKDGDKSENDGIDGTSGGSLTLVGSPNFGYRSVERDFESSLLIVTEDFELRKRMETELQQLMAYTSHVNATTFKQPERKLRGLFNWSQGWWISIASRFVKPFM